MTPTEEIAADLRARMPSLKRGSLSVFGDIFGGRVDNIHTLVGAQATGDWLRLDFDGEESLQVWHPDGVTATETDFKIQRASRVRWEWFYYGREHILDNRYFIEHAREGDEITVSTDAGWASRSFSPSTQRPAVELLGL